MTNVRWKEVAEVVGVTAIVASLIFVGIELRQSRQIAIADIYQQRSAMIIELHAARLSSEPLAAARDKREAGEALTEWDAHLLNTEHYVFFTYWENVHFQHEFGLMPEEQWRASQRAMSNYMRANPDALEFWNAVKFAMRDSFVEAVERAIADG